MTAEQGPPRLSGLVAVVPVYNTGARVRRVIDGLLAAGCRVVAVDDGSTDGGPEALKELPVDLLRFDRNRGKGHALIAGFRKALEDPKTAAVAVLDADGQHDPGELPGLFATFGQHGADLIIGARDFSGGSVPFRSRFGNVITVVVAGALLGRRLSDTQSGYRILSRRLVEAVLREIPGGRYETEMAILALALRGGFSVASMPIKTIYEPGNATSHFRKGRDSWLIYRTLFGAAIKRRKRQ